MSPRIFRIKDQSGDELRVMPEGPRVLVGVATENRLAAVWLTENQIDQLIQELQSILLRKRAEA